MDAKNKNMDSEVCHMFDSILNTLLEKEFLENIDKLKHGLERLTSSFREKTTREEVGKKHIEILGKVLEECAEWIQKKSDNNYLMPEVFNCTTECYRTLRNICAGCKANQDYVIETTDCISLTAIILKNFTDVNNKPATPFHTDVMVMLRCCVQFLSNLVAGHSKNGKILWNQFAESFRCLLYVGDTKLSQYTFMVVHSAIQGAVLDPEWKTDIASQESFSLFICRTLKTIIESDAECGIYVIEDAMKMRNMLENIYPVLTDKERIVVLEVLLNQLKSISDSCEGTLEISSCPCLESLRYLSKLVVSYSYNILELAEQDSNTETSSMQSDVIVKQIEVLGQATSNHTLYKDLQEEGDMLTCSINLLDAIHKLGKGGNNPFSSVVKIGDSSDVDTEHPVYGLKKDLIRLIANMCFKHKANQDRAGELNAIPLILDLTNIDKKNPFITQWAILAIRNLCEDNQGNKAVLSGLKEQGLADNTAVLRELGIDAEIRGDKVYVKPPTDRRKDEDIS